MKILVVNAGSSSLKFQLIETDGEKLLAGGICEEIGAKSRFKFKVPGREDYVTDAKMPTHSEAIKLVLDTLTDKKLGVIGSVSEIGAVGHRVVHGGERFSGSVLITDDVKASIIENSDLSPLHNPANLIGIRACEELMDVPQVAVFDTSFHQTMPDYAYMYAIPYEYYDKYKLRRYGFHGTSHRYVSERAAAMLGKAPEDVNVVTCHLGNGSSIAAVKGGRCLDTTMGVTPLEGMMMGTRSGNIDPAIIPFLMRKGEVTTADDIDKLLNKRSGMLGINGVTTDNREILRMAEEGNERCRLIERMFVHQLTKFIGGYIAAMRGADAIVFTGGIGENTSLYREKVCENLEFLGVKIDPEKNKIRGQELDISADGARVRVLVIPTNEELVIARDTYAIVSALKK